MDDLSKIINHVTLSAEVFYSGNLCGIQTIGSSDGGHLHILESGKLTIITNEGHKVCLDTPSVIFIPDGSEHRVIASESDQANLICAVVKFNSANSHSLIKSLPQFIYYEISGKNDIGNTAAWLFREAFDKKTGRQAMIDKLADIFLLQVLRDVVENGVVLQGVLSAMTHPRLSSVIEAIHKEPERPWTVESLAEIAALSRSKFAALFKETVGQPPNNYITDLRVAMAKDLLQKGKSINLIANEVGYEHGSALARVFRKTLGLSPTEWVNSQRSKS
ncbi:cupin domain-containing protein [Thalassotalea marina]|uniref:AraC family transcriptional regulator n=1 Tax=Thalassotalea marina TaxID=1673741 RepID=A0A919BR31_9GAMM|nr:cupin domain-containing protein [Thalassotalea marina]GHG05259.1 AraC family transcriptional regulator [Thalassotalea marina]